MGWLTRCDGNKMCVCIYVFVAGRPELKAFTLGCTPACFSLCILRPGLTKWPRGRLTVPGVQLRQSAWLVHVRPWSSITTKRLLYLGSYNQNVGSGKNRLSPFGLQCVGSDLGFLSVIGSDTRAPHCIQATAFSMSWKMVSNRCSGAIVGPSSRVTCLLLLINCVSERHRSSAPNPGVLCS